MTSDAGPVARSTPPWYASLVVRTVALVAVVVLLLGVLVVAFITRRDRDDARATADRLQELSEVELRGLASDLVANHQDIARALVEGFDARTRQWLEDEPLSLYRDKVQRDRVDVDALRQALVAEVRARGRAEREHVAIVSDRLGVEAKARVDRAAEGLRGEADARAESESASRTARLATRLSLLLAGMAFLLGLALWRSVLRPVARLRADVARMSAGDLATPVGETTARRDELGVLARDVDVMRAELARAREGLEREVRAKTADLARTLAERTTALTELEATKDRLVQSAKMASLGTLAGGLAHEFNNLLGGIRACLDGARAETKDASVLEDLDMAARTADRGIALVRGMLDVAKPGARGLVPLDLEALVDDVVSTVGPAVHPRQVTITRERSPVPPVLGDAAQLHQVALNLVTNALQAVDDGEPVVVATRVEAGHGIVEVRDGGAGVPAADRDRIFDPFFTGREGGTGLGLFVSYGIVERHGGRIEVGTAPEGGARFVVRLPLVRPAGPESRPAS